jgi:hypothetical protein
MIFGFIYVKQEWQLKVITPPENFSGRMDSALASLVIGDQ